MNPIYNKSFYEKNRKYQKALAKKIVPYLVKEYLPNSIVDFGCGSGMFLRYFVDYAKKNYKYTPRYRGIDNHSKDFIDININSYVKHDLSKPIHLSGMKFDLVISLEVAEHLPKSASKIHVDNLIKHTRNKILFSAATPGQGGEGHINEQPHEYWHYYFSNYGYKPDDCIQKLLKGDKSVPFWYRRNIFVYER